MKQMVLLIGLVTVFVFDSVAATRHWAGVGGSGVGDFEEPSNWTQGAVPGADDLVAVNNMNNEDFVVTLNSDVTNTKLSLMAPTPGYETLFVMNQHVWSVTDMVSSWHASGGRITFTNGTLRTQTGHFMPDSGALVTNLMLFMKEVTCEMTTASFRAGTASFEGGQLQVSDYISVGARGFPAATVKLDRGVQCNVTNSILIASDTGATGEFINVNGALTVEGPSNSLYAGQGGCGTMILNGGSIYISGVSFIGTDSSSVGHMKITGGSNTFGDTASGSTVNVGYEGKGSLLVGGGTNYVGGSASVGVGVSGVGEMTVTGGLWTIRRFLFVGESGLGTLNVRGGELRISLIAAGRYPNATGTVNVSGGC